MFLNILYKLIGIATEQQCLFFCAVYMDSKRQGLTLKYMGLELETGTLSVTLNREDIFF